MERRRAAESADEFVRRSVAGEGRRYEGVHRDTARQVGTRDPDQWSDDELIPGMRYPDDADGWDRR